MSNYNALKLISQIDSGDISPGRGYSSDSQQIASQICYNVTAGPVSGQRSYIKLATAMSFLDFQRDLHVDVTAKTKFWIFSANAEANYMRSVQNKDASMSLNYYQYAAGDVSINSSGFGKAALNKFGEAAYQNGQNPYFGLVCGDNFIYSYKEGALIALGINIEFKSSSGKEQFKAIAGGSFADIFSASVDIQKIINQTKIAGSLSIQAFQAGGDPAQLAHILSKDPNGDYYATSCSLSAMTYCVKAANGLLDYAKNNFPKQFSFQDNKGLSPLGVGFIQYVPIEFIGLNSTSLVTPQILEWRKELATTLQENQYYQQKFNELVSGYIVPWDTTSNLYKSCITLLNQANVNVNILMNPDPYHGPIGCYSFPYKCKDIFEEIMSEIKPITPNDLKVLNDIKYSIGFSVIDLYKNGDTPSSWGVVVLPGDRFKSLEFVFINDTLLRMKDFYYGSDGRTWCALAQGQSSNGINYQGTITNGVNVCKYVNKNQGWNKVQSPYYFGPYNDDNYDVSYKDQNTDTLAYVDTALDSHGLGEVNSSHINYDAYLYDGM